MKDGPVHQGGSPLEWCSSPVNRFVVGIVGRLPMNFWNGRVLCEDSELYFEEGSGRIRLPEWFRGYKFLADRIG